MKIFVVNRETIEAGLDLKGRYIVISLYDSDAHPAKVKKQPGLWAVLPMAIDDTDPTLPFKLPTSIAMTEDHAAAIWDFVEAHRNDVDTIVVHCNHGSSRSPAVGQENRDREENRDSRPFHDSLFLGLPRLAGSRQPSVFSFCFIQASVP